MLKKISALFFGQKSRGSATLKKADDGYNYQYPPFPKGIPAEPIEKIIEGNNDIIKQVILARGLAGDHNKNAVEEKVMEPIRHLARMVHLLPASDKDHFRSPGGLFRFCLESGLFAIRYAERRILTRVTPETRRESESLWMHAAFLTSLYSEPLRVISRISVYSDKGGMEWHFGSESLVEWLLRNKLQHYQIRWSELEDRSILYAVAGKSIQTEQAKILANGEKAIYKTLMAALLEQGDRQNPLVDINITVRLKLIERDLVSDPSRYGRPLTGMHLEPWLIDAMRHLFQKKRWSVNNEMGRVWYGLDGVYLVWPLSATDMQHELRDSESPFIPSTVEILAELMMEAGIIDTTPVAGGYVFDIAVPQPDSPDKKLVTAIRLVRHEILFQDDSGYEPLAINLGSVDERSVINTSHVNSNDEDDSRLLPLVANSVTVLQDKSAQGAKIDKKQEKNVNAAQETPQAIKELLGAKVSSAATTQYDASYTQKYNTTDYSDDYAEDYAEYIVVDNKVANDPVVALKQTLKVDHEAPKPLTDVGTLCASNKQNERVKKDIEPALLEKLINKDPGNDKSSHGSQINTSSQNTDVLKLFNKGKIENELRSRSNMLINELRKMPSEFLERLPGGITKVRVNGLRGIKLDHIDCINVLKASNLLVFVDDLEMGMDEHNNKHSRYFLVKMDLLNGR